MTTFEGVHRLAKTLSRPVYGEYGGFAGEFEVEGRVVWDLLKATVSMEGTENEEGSEPDWVPFENGL